MNPIERLLDALKSLQDQGDGFIVFQVGHLDLGEETIGDLIQAALRYWLTHRDA